MSCLGVFEPGTLNPARLSSSQAEPLNPGLQKWAHLGSNQGPTGYEPVALPAELWARQWPSYLTLS